MNVLNQDINSDSSAQFLAIFIHKMMQKDNPFSKSKELMKEVKTVSFQVIISLFRLLISKDMFEKFFSK